MPPVTFETFDSTPYLRAPRGNIRGIVSLSRALVARAPKGASDAIDRTTAKLEDAIEEAERGLTERIRELTPEDFSRQVELDGFADVMWGALRSGLELWKGFEHPGLARVLEVQKKKGAVATALRAGQDKAVRARQLAGKVFVGEGLSFTQRTYSEQSVIMGSILRIIEEDGLAEEIEAVVPPEVLVAIRACQPLYEGMVKERLERNDRRPTDLAVLRTKLQRAITQYCTAVLTLLDETEPQTLEQVMDALRPIDAFREQARSGRGGGGGAGGRGGLAASDAGGEAQSAG